MAESQIMQFRYIDLMLKAFQFFQQFNISSCLIHDVIQSVLIVVGWGNRLCTTAVWTFQDKRFTALTNCLCTTAVIHISRLALYRVDKFPMQYRSIHISRLALYRVDKLPMQYRSIYSSWLTHVCVESLVCITALFDFLSSVI